MKTHTDEPLAFIDLAAQQRAIRARIDAAIARVLDQGAYIMGPEVGALERDLSAFSGAKHVISCANGTDAIAMVLMAKSVGPGDAVFVPSFTFAATAEAVAWLGATPVFVDSLAETFNIDPLSLKQALVAARRLGLTPKAVIPVDLFGLPADYRAIEAIADEARLFVLSDAAQSFGASYHGQKVGTLGLATTTSFFPAKPLGCYGDGGAIFTDDDDLAAVLRSLRSHGQGGHKYDYVRIGLNSRLDTLQAAILIEKLAIFSNEIQARERIARRYSEALGAHAIAPATPQALSSVWAQYTLRTPASRRSAILAHLEQIGIPTAVYYPKPLHLQAAYQHFPTAGNGLPIAEKIASEALSLPMHPYLEPQAQDRIIAGFIAAVAQASQSSV
jgi:dTDP-4-amino-4,6-dideoxygalactose transaminase